MSDEKNNGDISRKSFVGWLIVLGAAFLGFLKFKFFHNPVTGKIIGPDRATAHLLLTNVGTLAVPQKTSSIKLAIIGGGISGLSAGWHLKKKGMHDFTLFELENQPGGNSSWGENAISRYPWGAHYLPRPTNESIYVKELLREMKVMEGNTILPEYLCFDPEERLYVFNTWQNGLLPVLGARNKELKEFEKFSALIKKLSASRGSDGKKVFTIPLELSSGDPHYLALDTITIREYLVSQGFSTTALFWYVEYACRDDYGGSLDNISAWAGLHYFCSRGDSHNIIWPEGNGRIAEYLHAYSNNNIKTGHLLTQIERIGNKYELTFYKKQSSETEKITAEAVIYAAPKFTLPRIFPSSFHSEDLKSFVYSPWITANLSLKSKPHGIREEAWDNVIYASDSLGYVNATHMSFSKQSIRRNYTWFYVFKDSDTLASRRKMLHMRYETARDMVLDDLSKPHPDIRDICTEMNFYFWAHAMIRPTPGYIWTHRKKFLEKKLFPAFYFAHSDISGISNFEEAQYRGVKAAAQYLKGG